MADMTNADSERIVTAVNQLDGIVAAISRCVGRFRDAITALDKGWVSEVKTPFMANYQTDEEAMREMLDQYREVSGQLRDIASDFDKTESEILSGASALRG